MDRLYVSYEKYRRMIAEKKILHRLVQGVRILTVALACYGWWGGSLPEISQKTYDAVMEKFDKLAADAGLTTEE